MASTITKKQISLIDTLKYESLREHLQTGDLVFCSGNYQFSKAIQYFTKSVWSHVGVIYKDENLGRMLVLESEAGIGVRLCPLSKYLKDYHGKNKPYKGFVVIARVDPAVNSDRVKKIISYGLDELTKPYDNWEIIRIMIRILFKITRKTKDRKYICSELIDECYKQAGVKFRLLNEFISPDDIWNDDKVVKLGRVL
ncbi:MAG: hypothetical protein IPO27_13310 [Bacteroidetes bacterium]|nr:hypothetical protein [Bacteroidota bacterium]